jgi:hypothetical protein
MRFRHVASLYRELAGMAERLPYVSEERSHIDYFLRIDSGAAMSLARTSHRSKELVPGPFNFIYQFPCGARLIRAFLDKLPSMSFR